MAHPDLPEGLFTIGGSDRWKVIGYIDRPAHIFMNCASGERSVRVIGSPHHDELKPVSRRSFSEADQRLRDGAAQRRAGWFGYVEIELGHYIYRNEPGGAGHNWSPLCEDIAALDWEDV